MKSWIFHNEHFLIRPSALFDHRGVLPGWCPPTGRTRNAYANIRKLPGDPKAGSAFFS